MKTLHLLALTLILPVAACGGVTPAPAPEPGALGAADGGTCPLPTQTPFGSQSFVAPCTPGSHTDYSATCGVRVVDTGQVTDHWWNCSLSVWMCVEACP